MERFMFAITASVFAAIFLVSIIVYGEHGARSAAIAAAFLGCVSQFAGPESKSYRVSIYAAYFSFAAGFTALILFVRGM